MKQYYVVGDIHGCLNKFRELLKHWSPKDEQLVLLGDLVDKGEDSLGVLLKAIELQENHGAIVIKGNHDEMFTHWLETEEDSDYYFDAGGRETINSFFNEPFDVTTRYSSKRIREYIQHHFSHVICFLQERPLYHYDRDFIFVHAGVNPVLKNWENSMEKDFLWIRNPFIYGSNETGRTIIFGHTPTRLLHVEDSDDIWISPCETKIGIDGAAVFGGKLHGIKLTAQEMDVYTV